MTLAFDGHATGKLVAAGLGDDEIGAWAASLEAARTALESRPVDAAGAAGAAGLAGQALLERLPRRSRRAGPEVEAGRVLVDAHAAICRAVCDRHAAALYTRLTGGLGETLTVAGVAARGGERFPGLLPDRRALDRERGLALKDKDGLELQQGLFFASVLADRRTGTHLARAALGPTATALEHLERFVETGSVDLGTARVEARDRVGHVELRNPGYLNAEDDGTLDAQEAATDLVLLHPGLDAGVLRGAVVDHPRYAGRRLFSAGINLTRLYEGTQSYLFYLARDLGWVNKLYRGIAADEGGDGVEKPWIAVVDGFAIGGGCQLLLATDYVLAERGAFFELPARKEGIIPGCANLRLPRFIGERLAHEAILFGRRFDVEDPDARGIVNDVVPSEALDARLQATLDRLLGSGMVSAAGNRRALRVQAEPLDDFRRYMAVYAREQAFCHLSDALVHNLERHWRGAGGGD